MKDIHKKFITSIAICFFLVSNVVAANEGRYYSMEDDHNTNWGQTVLFCCAVAFVIWLLDKIFESKRGGRKENESYSNNINERPTNKAAQHTRKEIICPECKGRGWVAGNEISNSTCPHCKGLGVAITIENERLLKRLLEIQENKRDRWNKNQRLEEEKINRKIEEEKNKELLELKEEQRKWCNEQKIDMEQGSPYFDSGLFEQKQFAKCREIGKGIRKSITSELEKCPQCKSCNGKDKSCKSCLGTGKELNFRIRYLHKQYKHYCKGLKLYVLDVDRLESKYSQKRKIASIVSSEWEMSQGLRYTDNEAEEVRKIKEELSKYPSCPYCEGKGYYETCQMAGKDLGLHTFIKRKCKRCNGTKYVYI